MDLKTNWIQFDYRQVQTTREYKELARHARRICVTLFSPYFSCRLDGQYSKAIQKGDIKVGPKLGANNYLSSEEDMQAAATAYSLGRRKL